MARMVAPSLLKRRIEAGEAQIVADGQAERAGGRIDHHGAARRAHRPPIRASSRRSADRRRTDGSCRSWRGSRPASSMTKPRLTNLSPSGASRASEPRWTQIPASRRRRAHRRQHRIVRLQMEMPHRPAPVAVEQAAHLRREQHRRAARGRLVDAADQLGAILLRVDAGLRLEERDLHAASIGSSRPSLSSAWRSSEPPTCTSSMKICGTRGAALGALDHLGALRPAQRDVIFLKIDALVAEQPLGARAIGAEDLGVDFDARHQILLASKWGRGPRSCQ